METQGDQNPNLTPPTEFSKELDNINSITKLLETIAHFPSSLRRTFRGEMVHQDKDGNNLWVQGSKPVFVMMNLEKNIPLKIKKEMPWGETKEVYVPNDEAIEEVISILTFAGVNQISPVGFNTPDNYLEDLKEFECKLAALLALKQKSWGLDKELLPMIQFKLKTIVQDIRSHSINGTLLKTLQTTVQRVEQYIENANAPKRGMSLNPY